MTRLIQFANNATSKLAANLSSSGTSITLTPGDGVKFPALSGGQVFYGTLVKASGAKEVVKITARSTDTLTIGTRAAEAVGGVQTALAFTAGDNFELRMTAGTLSSELDRLDAAAFLDVATTAVNYTVVAADICKLLKVNTASGNLTITLPQISTLTGSFEIQISKSSGDTNLVTVTRSSTDTINGSATYSLGSQYQCVWLVADIATNTWTAITSASFANRYADPFIGSGTAGPFTLSGDPGSKNNTDVYVGGVYQKKSTYTLTGLDLTLGGVVASGVFVECIWAQPVTIGTPSDGTVSTAKIIDGAVTPAKTTGLAPLASPTFTGTVVAPTFAGNVTGNVTGNVSGSAGTAGGLPGTNPALGLSTSGTSVSNVSQAGPMILGQGGGASVMTFHRPGSYAINFGLDTDDKLKIGGWSMGSGVSHIIQHGGNTLGSVEQTLVQYASPTRQVNGSVYTNSSGRPIFVSVVVNLGAGQSVSLSVQGSTVSAFGNNSPSTTAITVSSIVLAGQTYAVTAGGTPSFTWTEFI